jgi:hypothetical protein
VGGIPLVATQIQQQPSLVDTYSKLQNILGQRQEQQVRGVQLQQAQQSQADMQATTAAMRAWDGKDYTQIPSLILKNGGSANAVFAATKNIQDMKQKASEIAKNDAATNASNLDTAQKTMDQNRGRLLAIINGPDEQKQTSWDAELTADEQAGKIKPGAISHTYPGDDAATALANHFALGSTLAKEASEQAQAAARQKQADTAAGELALNRQKFAATPEELTRRATAVDANGQPTPDAVQAKAILAQQTKQAATTAGATASAEAAAKFPWEARLETMRQQGDPVFAYDPKNNQTVQVSRAEAQQAGFTNIVKVGQPEIDKAKTSAMQLGDATMNIQAYKQASQRMDELSGSDIATVSKVLGDSGFKAHFLGAELPTGWLNDLYQAKGWQDMPDTAKDAVVNYIAARPAAISLLRAINPGVRLTESQIATELKNIPAPGTPSDIRDKQFARLDRNIDQASKTLVKVPGVEMPSEIRDRLSTEQAAKDAVNNKVSQNQANASGQYRNAKGLPMKEGQEAYANGKYIGTVSKVYGDGSYDVTPD